MTATDRVGALLAAVHADQWGRIVASLIRLTGDWDLAEECAQDAFARALERWPTDGVPDNPGAWLTTAARNRAVDRLRRGAVETTKLKEVAGMVPAGPPPPPDGSAIPDDRLLLMFTCCHPALAVESQVALTLRTPRRIDHRRDRPRLPGQREDHGAAAGAGEEQGA